MESALGHNLCESCPGNSVTCTPGRCPATTLTRRREPFHCDALLISFTKSPYIWRDLATKRITRTENTLIFSWHLFSELPGFLGLGVPPSLSF